MYSTPPPPQVLEILGESVKSSFYFDDCGLSALIILFVLTCASIFITLFLLEVQGGVDEVCVCVLTGIWTEQYECIMRWWGSNPQ